MINITVGGKTFKVQVADTIKKRERGLQGVHYLPADTGMLFIWPEPKFVQMWMKDTIIPLDIVFIDEDQEVVTVDQGKPCDNTLLSHDNIQYVIELNKDSGIQVGDILDMPKDEDVIVMKILAPDGTTQMNLQGGERVISRRETRILVKKAKKAYLSDTDADYKNLGRYMFKILKVQNESKPEYVESVK